jgi:predicted MFS family arabinose efflux permease
MAREEGSMRGQGIAEMTHSPAAAPAARERWVVPALAGATFASNAGTLAFGALLPGIAADLGVGAARLGQIPALGAALGAALVLAVGPLADRHGHARTLTLALLALAAGALGAALAPAYGVLLAALLLAAPGQAAVGPAAQAIAGGRFAGDARRRAISWITAGISGAAIAGVPLLTAVAAAGGWRAAFGTLALLYLGGALLIRLTAGVGERRGSDRAEWSFLAAYRPPLRHRPTLVVLASNVLGRAGTAALTTYLGVFYALRHGFTTQQLGVAYLVLGVGILAGTTASGGWLGRLSPILALGGGRTVTGVLVSVALLAPLPTPAGIVLLALALACIGAVTVAATTLLASEAPGGRATVMGLNGTAMQIGTALGGAAGGLLLALGGFPALALGILGLYGAAALLTGLRPRHRAFGGHQHQAEARTPPEATSTAPSTAPSTGAD